jgi:hypothetical protein
MTDGKNERKKNRKQNADRRNHYFAAPERARPRLQTAGAHLSAFHHDSRPKESFITRNSASGQASWDAADSDLSFERAFPAPACPLSPARTAHPGHSCPDSEVRNRWRHARMRTSESKGTRAINNISRAALDLKFLCRVAGWAGGTSNPPHECAEGLMPKAARARVASPPAGTALAPAAWLCLPGRVRMDEVRGYR